jgi:spore coat protein E
LGQLLIKKRNKIHIASNKEYINTEEGRIMSEVREIVTRAVIAKGRKIFKLHECVTPPTTVSSVLGCWVINHEFEANFKDPVVEVNQPVHLAGKFEIDIWYAENQNQRTEIAREQVTYDGMIKVREIIGDHMDEHPEIVARILQQPTCTNACINAQGQIEVDIIFEVLVEVIGETKMLVTVFNCPEPEPIDDIDDCINEDFLKKDKE